MRGRLLVAGLGPGGLRTVLTIGALSAVRAIALVMIAESLAASIAAIASATGGRQAALTGALLIGAIGALLRAGTTWAIGTLAAREAVTAKTRIRGELADRIAVGGLGEAGGSAAGGLEAGSAVVLATTGIDDLDDYYGSVIPAAVAAVVVPVVLGARILSLDWLSAVVIAVTLPLIPLFMGLIGMHTRERTDAASRALHRLADHLVELAHGLPVLVGLGRVDEQTEALAGIQSELRRRTSLTLRTAFLSALALELIGTLSVAVVAVLLGIRLMNGGVPLATALVVLLLAPECFGAVREVGAAFHASQNGTAALRRVTALLASARRTVRAVAGRDVVVSGLTVRYPARDDPDVAGFGAEFRRGRLSVVVGPSGAGKSTLLGALAGTLAPDAEVAGQVRGVDPDRLALAAQAPRFFGATVEAELALATADPAAVTAVLEELDLAGLRHRRPSELSPGEARRLAVARAALRVRAGATTALFDEPTAHLDRPNAARVRALLASLTGSAAVIVVSHDPALVAEADAVIRMPEPARAPASAPPSADSADSADASATARPLAPTESPATASGPAEHEPARTLDSGSAAGTLRALLGASPARWLLAVLLGVAATGFGLSLTAVSAWLIVRAAEHPEIMYLLVAIVGVRFFGLGRSVARYAERLVTHGAIMTATDALRLRIWRGIAARGAGSRRLQEGGAAVDYLVTSIDEVRELVPRVVTPLAVGALSLAGIVTTVALLDPAVAPLVGAVLVLAACGIPWLVRHGDAAASAGRVAARAELGERVGALAGASTELRANGMSRAAAAQVRASASRLAVLDRRAARSAGRGTALLTLVTAGLAVLVPALAESSGTPSAETVAVIALLVLAAFEPLADATRAVQRAPRLSAALARLRPFLEERERADGGTDRGMPLARPITSVEFDGVAARWPGAETEVFRDLDARIEPGRWLVVDGPSGSGKTTLLTLLLGELAPSAGAIQVDGIPLPAVRRGDWRQRVAWCPQEAHVFDSTIRANLLIARPRTDPVSDTEMRDALIRVGLGPLLDRLADGLDARIGASGGALSGGERQRLAVARALLGRSELLLLDEPTAHLDEPTAAAMMADIRAATPDRMVVLVSHRADDLAGTDRTIRLGATARSTTNERVAA